MKRWWNDWDQAFDVVVRLDKDDDPEMAVGTALLVFHTIGKAAYDYAAHSLNPTNGFLDAADAISQSQLIGAVCKTFDEVSGIPGYGATRMAGIKHQADEGARALAASLRQDGMPWALVCKRVGETYGLPASDVVPIRKSMGGHDLITALAADRALLRWAAAISKAEVMFSKAEKDTFTVDGKERTVHRNEQGEFVSAGDKEETPSSRYMERMKQKRANKQPKRRKPQGKESEERTAEQEKKIEAKEEKAPEQWWGESAKVKSKEEQEKERQEQIQTRRQRAAHGEAAEAAFQQQLAEQQGRISNLASRDYKAAVEATQRAEQAAAAARRTESATEQAEVKETAATEVKATRTQSQQKIAEKKAEEKQQQKRDAERGKARGVHIFDPAEPWLTNGHLRFDENEDDTLEFKRILMVPKLIEAVSEEDVQPVDRKYDAYAMWSGIDRDQIRDAVMNDPQKVRDLIDITSSWQHNLLQVDPDDRYVDIVGGLNILESTYRASDTTNQALNDVAFEAISNYYHSNEREIRHQQGQEDAWRSDTFGEHDDIGYFLDTLEREAMDRLFVELPITEALKVMYDNASGGVHKRWMHENLTDKEIISGLTRALQIGELTAEPHEFASNQPLRVGNRNRRMQVTIENQTDDERNDALADVHIYLNADKPEEWRSQLNAFLHDSRVTEATAQLTDRLGVVFSAVEDIPGRGTDFSVFRDPTVNERREFNGSSILRADIPGSVKILPLVPDINGLEPLVVELMQARDAEIGDVQDRIIRLVQRARDSLPGAIPADAFRVGERSAYWREEEKP